MFHLAESMYINLYSAFIHIIVLLLFITNLSACGGSSGGDGDSSSTTTSTTTSTSTTSTTTTTLPTAGDMFSLGGTVTGLTGTVTLLHNDTDGLILKSNGTYTFNTLWPLGEVYNVAISQQPNGQICSVKNSSGVVTNNITDIDITCTSNTVKVSLSGTISSAANILSDSDTNDPFATTFESNDTGATAQNITNYVKINGFVSLIGTFEPGDNFEFVGDEFDIYKVHLDADQLITLQVVDFDGADTYQGDIDLYLFDSEINLMDFSDSVGEFEYLISAQEGDYFIVVEAYSGISKYVLGLGADVAGNALRKGGGADFAVNEAIALFKPAALVQNFSSAGKSYSMSLKHEDTGRATLVHFEPPTNNHLKSTIQAANSNTLHPFHEEMEANNPHSYEKYKTLKNIKSLNNRQDIEYAEPNYMYHASQVPNDTYYNFQWHYRFINLPQAWDITTGSPAAGDVIVAIIDTGVVLTHPDLQEKFVAGYDFISDPAVSLDGDGLDSNPNDPGDGIYSGSSSWHGTHVAGTVAAKTNNNLGVAGVAWDARLMPLRVLGYGGGSAYDIDQAVRYAAGLPNDSGTVPARKADIINLSFGGGGYSQAAQQTYLNARAAGVIIVAAAGNENSNQLSYPASYTGVISVSATDYNGNRAPYSNFNQRVDVAAPGGNSGADLNNDGYADGVLSTLIDDTSSTNNFIYYFYQGTSMATPHVAGVLALMKAVFPDLSPGDVDTLLQNGDMTIEAGTAGRDDIYGHGIIDALKAVQAAEQLTQGGDMPSIIISTPAEISLNSGESEVVFTVTKTGSDSVSITSITANAGWLTVSPVSVDQNGLGQYRVSVDRAGLTGNVYTGLITFNVSQGSPKVVPVSMAVSYLGVEGDAGTLYVLLNDENVVVVESKPATPLGNGQYAYTFENVSPGSYLIAAGSDVDNDYFICQYGESCGAYPSLDYFSPIHVTNQDITNLDFTADIFSGLVTAGVAQSNEQESRNNQHQIFRRKKSNNNKYLRRLN